MPTDSKLESEPQVRCDDGLGRSSTMQDDLYECSNRKCRHIYKHKDAVYVQEKRPGPKTLPTWRGTCPKCGCKTFFMAKNRKRPNDRTERQPPGTAAARKATPE